MKKLLYIFLILNICCFVSCNKDDSIYDNYLYSNVDTTNKDTDNIIDVYPTSGNESHMLYKTIISKDTSIIIQLYYDSISNNLCIIACNDCFYWDVIGGYEPKNYADFTILNISNCTINDNNIYINSNNASIIKAYTLSYNGNTITSIDSLYFGEHFNEYDNWQIEYQNNHKYTININVNGNYGIINIFNDDCKYFKMHYEGIILNYKD